MNKEYIKSYLKVICEDYDCRELTIKYDDQEYDVIVKNLYFNPADRSVGIFEPYYDFEIVDVDPKPDFDPEENDEFLIAVSDALIERDTDEIEDLRERDEEWSRQMAADELAKYGEDYP